jgi:hypothetical protein
VKLIVADPVPLAGSVTHAALELALHAQAAELMVSVTLPGPPLPPMLTLLEDRLALHPLDCVTGTVCPATVSEPARAGPALTPTLYVVVPLPVPLVGETANQLSLLVAVHGQAALLAVIVRLPEPAAAEDEMLVGVTVKVQPLAWLTVKVCPAIVSVPERATLVFAPTV